MTKAAALELGPYNIRVNSVHPGVIVTAMIKQHISANVAQYVPLRHIGNVEDIANHVL